VLGHHHTLQRYRYRSTGGPVKLLARNRSRYSPNPFSSPPFHPADLQICKNESIFLPEAVPLPSTSTTTYESISQPDPARIFEQLPPQTDWTQDLEDLLPQSSVSPFRSPTHSAPDPSPSYDHPHPIPAPYCDQPMAEIDDDFDLDELLLSLTGHQVAVAVASGLPLSDPWANPQLPPSTPTPIPLSMQPSPPPPPPIHEFPAPPRSVECEVHEPEAVPPPPTLSSLSTALPSPALPPALPCIAAPFPPAQYPAQFLPSPASLDTPAEHFFDGPERPTPAPAVPSAPSLPGSGYATAEGSPDLVGVEPYSDPCIAFDSVTHPTTPFDWAALTRVALPPDFAGLPSLFAATPQVQIESLGKQVQVQINGDMARAPAEVVDQAQAAEELQVQVSAPEPEPELDHHLDLVRPESILLPEPSAPSFSGVEGRRPIKPRQRKRKPVGTDHDTVRVADGNKKGNSTATATAGGKKPGKRQKGGPAKPRASRRKRGASVGETTKEEEGSVDGPKKEKMFVTTDESGRLKMLPVRARAAHHGHGHGEEVSSSSANASLQPPPVQLPTPQADVPSPPPLPPRAKPVVPRRILPHPDTSIPAPQPPAGQPPNASSTSALIAALAPELRMPAVPTVPTAPTSVPQHGTQGPIPGPHMVSAPAPALAPVPAPNPTPAATRTHPGPIVAPLPRYAASYNHFASWDVGFMGVGSQPEAQQLNTHSPPIGRHHQAQCHTFAFGTGVVDARGQIDVDVGQGHGGGTLVQYQHQHQHHQDVLPVYPEYSSVPDSTCVSVPDQVQALGYHQPKPPPAPAPAPAPAPLSLAPYSHVETLQSQYYHSRAQLHVQPTQALHGSMMYAAPSAELDQQQQLLRSYHYHYQQQQQQNPPALQFACGHNPYEGYQRPLYSDASMYTQMPVESQYPPYAQESYMSGYHRYV
jgi:hypothetical protein